MDQIPTLYDPTKQATALSLPYVFSFFKTWLEVSRRLVLSEPGYISSVYLYAFLSTTRDLWSAFVYNRGIATNLYRPFSLMDYRFAGFLNRSPLGSYPLARTRPTPLLQAF